jgi:DNA-binding MarR family transcriptional regulator
MHALSFRKMKAGADRIKAAPAEPSECNCLAIRQAARHVTQLYDQLFAPVGLRATQFAILSRLRREGPLTINALAALLVMDRTTLGRNILPLQRDGLIEIVTAPSDRRRRELRLTESGRARHATALECWAVAQQRFENVFGKERAAVLRRLLHDVTAADFAPEPGGTA